MATAREIHRHMKSVGNIGKITKAMKMVAAARLRRAQEKAAASRPYAIKIKEVLSSVVSDPSILAGLSAKKHPLLQHRDVKKVGYLVLASDKGLAGAYSSNALKKAVAEISECEHDVVIITSGRKARDFFQRRGYKVLPPAKEKGKASASFIFEPDEDETLQVLAPKYLETVVYAALVQSAASELGSRMTAMSSATDNAGKLVQNLELSYNKARQASITRELNEIVGGVEALKQAQN